MTTADPSDALGCYPLVEPPVVPEGYRPGDVPLTSNWKRELWVVSPPKRTESQDRILESVIREANTNSISISCIRTEEHRFSRERLLALRPSDARRLYLRLHRALVGVLALGGFRVQQDISESVTRKTSIPLEGFIKYKSFYRLLSRSAEVELAVRDFITWSEPETGSVNFFRDPRCLPFMIFEDSSGISLETAEGRRKFEQKYCVPHKPAHRTDAKERVWEIGQPHAPSYFLHVKGCNLPLGSHWDVQMKRKETLANGWERWIFAAREHANIHPNAEFHGPNGTRTHGINKQAPPARTPRHNRQKAAHVSKKKMPRR